MLIVDIESGEIVFSEAMNLGNVVLVAAQCARWWSSRRDDIFNESGDVSLSSLAHIFRGHTDPRNSQILQRLFRQPYPQP